MTPGQFGARSGSSQIDPGVRLQEILAETCNPLQGAFWKDQTRSLENRVKIPGAFFE